MSSTSNGSKSKERADFSQLKDFDVLRALDSGMRWVIFRACKFSDYEGHAVGKMLQVNQHLEALDLLWCSWNLNALSYICKGLEQRVVGVKKINFKGSYGMGDSGLHLMVEVLKVNRNIQELRVSDIFLGEKTACDLVEAAAKGQVIRTIEMRSAGLGGPAAVEMARILLRDNKSITRVLLSRNCFGEQGGKAFGELLAQDTVLEEVNLKYCNLGRGGFGNLMKGVEQNKSLRRLWVYGGDTEEYGPCVASMLMHNSCLKELRVNHSVIEKTLQASMIAAAMEHNHSLTSLHFDAPKIGEESVCKELLSRNGSLVDGSYLFENTFRRNRRMRRSASKATLHLLMIRWLRRSVLDMIPKDVIILIAKHVWSSRTHVDVWSVVDQT